MPSTTIGSTSSSGSAARLPGSRCRRWTIGLLFGASLGLVTLLAWVWGFFIIADSAQFSALVTESVPPHAVGTTLTVQTALGFLLTTRLDPARPTSRGAHRLALGLPDPGPRAGRRLAALRGR